MGEGFFVFFALRQAQQPQEISPCATLSRNDKPIVISTEVERSLRSWWKVDAVVFGDEADGGRGEFSGEGADTHRSENRAAGGEVTLEGAI